MKALAIGLILGAVTSLVLAAEARTGGSLDTRIGQQPDPGDNDLVHIASASVLGPERVAWSQDGSALYIVSFQTVSVLDPETGSLSELRSPAPGDVVLDVSPNGMLAVMRDFDSVVLLDSHTGAESPLAQDVVVSSAAFSPDGGTLALVLDNGSRLQLRDVASGEVRAEHTSASLAEGAFSVSFAPSGQSLTWFAPAGGHAVAVGSGDYGPFISFGAPILDVQMCPGETLAVSTEAGLSLWDTANGELTRGEEDFRTLSGSCASDGRLAVTTDLGVVLLDLQTLSTIDTLPIEALDAELSLDGRRLAVVGAEGEISVWEQ